MNSAKPMSTPLANHFKLSSNQYPIATGITTGRRSEKRLMDFQNKGVATIVFMENYGKPKKTRTRLIYENQIASPGVGYAWGRY